MTDSIDPIERADEIAAMLIQIYEIHEVIIAETGGMPGLREAHAPFSELCLTPIKDIPCRLSSCTI